MLHSDTVCRAVFWIQTAVFRRRRGPNENQVFAVTLRRRHRDVKNGVTACSASKADPGCSSFVPLCVPEGQFVSSGPSESGERPWGLSRLALALSQPPRSSRSSRPRLPRARSSIPTSMASYARLEGWGYQHKTVYHGRGCARWRVPRSKPG